MKDYSLVHVSDAVLLRDLPDRIGRERLATADVLASIAEVDARRLYVRAGYSSMHLYCVEELHLSDDAAFRRIRAARAGRKFPALLEALTDGRLNLTAVSLLAPHVTKENIQELIRLATSRRKADIEALLARQFPVPERPAILRPIYVKASNPSLLVPGRVDESQASDEVPAPSPAGDGNSPDIQQPVPGRVAAEASMASSQTTAPERPNVAAPPSIECFLLQVTIAKSTRDKLRHLQALLSHAIPTGDVARVLDRALDVTYPRTFGERYGKGIEDNAPL